jgi:pantetheine-phosphate adenylyltransferase
VTGASTGVRLTAVYPGSFDPITTGHIDIVERAAALFEQVIIAVGRHPTKPGFFPVNERCELINRSVAHLGNAEAASFDGLVVDFCRARGARVIVRGLRAVGDFEGEHQMALANRDLAPGIETVFLIPSPGEQYVSSSLVREIAGHGGGFERYVPEPVAAALRARIGKPRSS